MITVNYQITGVADTDTSRARTFTSASDAALCMNAVTRSDVLTPDGWTYETAGEHAAVLATLPSAHWGKGRVADTVHPHDVPFTRDLATLASQTLQDVFTAPDGDVATVTGVRVVSGGVWLVTVEQHGETRHVAPANVSPSRDLVRTARDEGLI